MSSRYNTIYLGEAGDVADELSVEDVMNAPGCKYLSLTEAA